VSEKEGPYHHGNLRAELLAAAEKALGTVGVDGISLRGLARDLGVSHAAPSHHFRDKQSLLDALAVEGFTRLSRLTAKAVEQGGSVRDRAEAMVRVYVRFAREHEDLLAVMLSNKHHPEASEALQAAAAVGFQVTVDLLAEGQREGVVRAGDPAKLALVASAHLHGAAAMLALDMFGDMAPEEVIQTSVELIWTGLQDQPGTP
jgi:AcrR family transcriptional regulator